MRVSREGDVFIAMRVTGPTHNILKLDFSPNGDSTQTDRSTGSGKRVSAEDVEAQLAEALEAFGVDRSEISNVVFDSSDTPSSTVYKEMATAILNFRKHGGPHRRTASR